MAGEIGQDQERDPNIIAKIMLLDTMKLMRNEKAEKNIYRYFVHLDFCLKLISPYMEAREKDKLNIDYKELYEEIRTINASEDTPKDKELSALRIMELFALSHEYYIYKNLTALEILKRHLEGEIEIGDTDIEHITKIIRTSAGLETSIKNAAGAAHEQKNIQI